MIGNETLHSGHGVLIRYSTSPIQSRCSAKIQMIVFAAHVCETQQDPLALNA